MLSIFTKTSYTKEKGGLAPLYINEDIQTLFENVLTLLKQKGFSSINGNNDYFEIYAVKESYEYTISLLRNNEHQTVLNILVFCDEKRGTTKKKLKTMLRFLSDELR